MIPDWWEFILLALASFRTWWLVAEDTILNLVRRRVVARWPSEGLAEFMDCPFCSGAWITVLWWAGWLFAPYEVTVAAAVFALSAAVGIVGARVSAYTPDN